MTPGSTVSASGTTLALAATRGVAISIDSLNRPAHEVEAASLRPARQRWANPSESALRTVRNRLSEAKGFWNTITR
jgi:hypothetical protein